MRLAGGQTVTTEGESLIMVSLDDTKLMTMEESSKAEIKARGKKLLFNLLEGNLFFNDDGSDKEVQRSFFFNEFTEWMENSGEDKRLFSARRFYHLLENTFEAAGYPLIKYQDPDGLGWMYRTGRKIA